MKDQITQVAESPEISVQPVRHRLERVIRILYLIAAVALFALMFSLRAPASDKPATAGNPAAAAQSLERPTASEATLTTRDAASGGPADMVSE